MSSKPFRSSSLKVLLLTCAVVVAVSGLERVGNCFQDALAQCAYGKNFEELTPLQQGYVLGPLGPQGLHRDCIADREHAEQVRAQQEALLPYVWEEIAQSNYGKSYKEQNFLIRALVRDKTDTWLRMHQPLLIQDDFIRAYRALDESRKERQSKESREERQKHAGKQT